MMAALNKLAIFLSLVALPIVSSNDIDLGGLLDQATGGNVDLSNVDLGGLLNPRGQGQGQGQGQGGLNLDTILVKDESGKVNMAETLKRLEAFGFTLKDLLKAAGLGDNPQVLMIAEQFITDPNSLDEGKKVIVCEAMEVLMEDKPEVGNTLATLGMDTTTLCASRYGKLNVVFCV